MIGFVGLSHLGLVSSVCNAAQGFQVIGFDADDALVRDLQSKKLPVYEPELDHLVDQCLGKQITFTSNVADLRQCDVVYFARDVKTNDENVSDLGPLNELIQKTLPHLAENATVVVLSQVPPGFSRKLAQGMKQALYYQVETLIFGRAVERASRPERYIVGCARPEADLPDSYRKLLSAFDCPILKMRYESAELAKISINMCLVSSISVANTLAEVCEKIGAEWSEIVEALRLDRRIGQYSYLSPGLGIAGGNLERDLITVCTLAKENGTDSQVVEAWMSNLKYRLNWVLRVLQTHVFPIQKDPQFGVWGLAYKQDTHSTKNSPSLATLESLKGNKIKAYDPQVVLSSEQLVENLVQVSSAMDACRGVDILMVLTPWKEFSTSDLNQVRSLMSGNTILDPYGVLDSQKCQELGFAYHKLGSHFDQKGI